MPQLRVSRKPRINRVPRIASTAAAIRSALALSAAVLALSGSGIAAAGTCAVTGTNTVSCNGVFTDTVNDTIDPGDVAPDLTLVLGDEAPTSVTPAAGDAGVLANWGGDVTVISYADITTVDAVGIYANGYTATLENHGDVLTDVAASINAVTLIAYSDVIAGNDGSIQATTSTGFEIAAVWAASVDGTVSVDNAEGGEIHASSLGNANAIYVSGDAGASVYNGGEIGAYSAYGQAIGIKGYSQDGDLAVVNSGDILATSSYFDAFGARLIANAGSASFDNSGYVHATSDYGNATGMLVVTRGAGDNYMLNTGDVVANSDLGVAAGIVLTSVDGDIEVVSSGDVTAYSGNPARGIVALALGTGNVTVDNTGDLGVTSTDSQAVGIYALTRAGDSVDVANAGAIEVYGYSASYGILAGSLGADVAVDNSGTIHAGSAGSAYGIEVLSYNAGDVSVDNSGSVEAYSVDGLASAVHSTQSVGDFYLYNAGTLLAYSVNGEVRAVSAYVIGIDAGATVVNAGSIEAISAYGNAAGVVLLATGDYGFVEVDNAGSISADAYNGAATGVAIAAYGQYGEASLDNAATGSIYAGSAGSAVGASVSGGVYAALTNAGDIEAVASSDAGAYGFAIGAGVSTFYGAAYLDNSGAISALADGDGARAIGAFAAGYGANVTVDNSGNISAAAYAVTASAHAYGITVQSALLSGTFNNTGAVQASASGAFADALGAYVSAGESALVYTTAGSSIDAMASAQYSALATGAYVGGLFGNLYSDGAISAEAYAGAYLGSARATGVIVAGAFSTVYLLDDATVSATAEGDYALAIGSRQDGYFSALHNEGSIEASASGDTGFAIGAIVAGYALTQVYNSGDIAATGSGDAVEAIGLFASSVYYGVDLSNHGSISADSDYLAVAVQLDTATYNHVYNYGSIEAAGDGANVAIFSAYTSTDYVYNHGTITGALWTGDGDDYLLNGEDGTWNPGQTASDFGDGDDAILNLGTINLQDSVIDLGLYDVAGNSFDNYGVITVAGLYNLIHMGQSPLSTLVPSANPLAFYNGGVLDFQDGAADDMLTIIGDFAGDGDINLDVSALDGSSDILYIDGSVVDGTVATVNVALLDLPQGIETVVPMVYVSGDSVASNFELGDVSWDEADSFVTLDFDLIADIDATNATPDVFALGIEVTGLSDVGTIATTVAPAVHSLFATQIGTWRQRMGVIDSFSKGGISLWARVFYNRGDFDPDHDNANFGAGGNFEYESFNSGAEAGVDFAVTDEFSIGLLLSQSRAKNKLGDPGIASAKIEADTWGVYGTWISPNGFYLDASYRWMNFDTTLESSAGIMESDGDAEAFNIEFGYAWTLASGLKIEPQLQYTDTHIKNIDAFVTGSGMVFQADGGHSSRGRLGLSFRKDFGDADSGWLWTPYLTVSVVEEFDGDHGFLINDTFYGSTNTEGTSGMLELGFNARHDNLAFYGGFTWQDGGALQDFIGGHLGVRYTFGGATPAPPPVVVPAKTCAELDDDGDGINNCDDKCLGSAAGEAVGPDGCPVPVEPAPEPKPFRG